MSFKLIEIADQFQGHVLGDPEFCATNVASLEKAMAADISYLESKKQLKVLLSSTAGAVLTTAELAAAAEERGATTNFVIVKEPQAAFIEVMLLFRPPAPRAEIGVSKQAIIADSATIGDGCNIFPHAYIGNHVRLGKNCDIGPGVVIHDGTVVGDDCTIHANAVLYANVTVGDRVIIHANAVIGADGFGYRFVNGAFVKIPHTGTVILEDDVEIGAATTVDRAMIAATVIGQGTKLDNQVMIAHNCEIGRHNAFASQVGLAGSCTTGDYVQMGGQVGVVDHCKIGTGAKIGGKAGVVWDMPAGGTYHGIPAIHEKDALRNHFSIQKLPELREQIKELTRQLADLQTQLNSSTNTHHSKSAA